MVNFRRVEWYARRARVAYQSEAAIRQAYPETVNIGTPGATDVLYFVEHSAEERRQVVTVRGTDNLENALQDADYLREEDNVLGISVHWGFYHDAHALYRDLLPYLRKDYDACLTGHSLGAAISTLLMMHLYRDGFSVRESINFGQPKLTNREGAEAYSMLPLLRVVDDDDVVPLVPATTLADSLGGIYTHLGNEVILLDGPHFVYLDQKEAMSESRGSFWKELGEESIKAHRIANYLRGISDKLDNSLRVPFAEREKYAAG